MAGRPSTKTDAQKAEEAKAKGEKFKELGGKRVSNALDALRKIEPLANKSQYVYTDTQVKKIVDTLRASIDKIEAVFGGKEKASGGFEL